MNKIKKTITGIALATLLGGTAFIGTEVGRPDCDYVIVTEDKEICLTAEQVEVINEQIEMVPEGVGGFGGVKFGQKSLNLKEK